MVSYGDTSPEKWFSSESAVKEWAERVQEEGAKVQRLIDESNRQVRHPELEKATLYEFSRSTFLNPEDARATLRESIRSNDSFNALASNVTAVAGKNMEVRKVSPESDRIVFLEAADSKTGEQMDLRVLLDVKGGDGSRPFNEWSATELFGREANLRIYPIVHSDWARMSKNEGGK